MRRRARSILGWLKIYAMPITVLVLGLLASAGVYWSLQARETRRIQRQFHTLASAKIENVQHNITSSVSVLRSTRGLFHSSADLERREFTTYVQELLKRRGNILAVEWLSRIMPEERSSFEENLSSTHEGTLEITELDESGKISRASQRGVFYPVTYVAPSQRSTNRTVLGFDHWSRPSRRRKMQKARDQGEITATSTLFLFRTGETRSTVESSRENLGVYLFAPVYSSKDVPPTRKARREQIQGFVALLLPVDPIFAPVFESGEGDFQAHVFERSGEPREKLIYSNHPVKGNEALKAQNINSPFLVRDTLDIADHEWTAMLTPSSSYPAERGTYYPLGALLICLLLTGGLTAGSYRLSGEYLSREEQFYSIIDSATDAIINANERGVIIFFNPAAEEIFGYDSEEVMGKSLTILMPEKHREDHEAGFRRYLETGEEHVIGETVELEGERKNGDVFPIELSLSTWNVGQQTFFTGVIRDITERVEQKEELIEAREEAREANRAKSAFLAKMSHELRTPLTSIIGYAEMLEEDTRELGEENLASDAGRIRESGNHLLELINEILDLSKVEAGKMDTFVEEILIEDMVEGVRHTAEPLADKNNNELVVEVDDETARMRSDRTKIRQCLINLLSNACNFTEDGRIDLRVSTDSDTVVFEVEDSGVGIPPEQQEAMFEAFEQAEVTTKREHEGTGLGLTITQKFVRMLGGSIDLESEEGKGTKFTLEFPRGMEGVERDTGESVEDTSSEEPSVTGEGNLVLAIDDDPDVLEIIERTLEDEDYEVLTVESGKRGIELARQYEPDVITLDVIMPEMDGWSVISQLNEDEELRDIPVVLLTVTEDKELGYSLGVAEYVNKPIDRDQLIHVVNKQVTPDGRPALVVEDSDNDREMITRILGNRGWNVVSAENGEAALEKMKETDPGIILLDLMMPEMDGFEFLEHKKEMDEWKDVPVIVLTVKQLTEEERSQLQEKVKSIMRKGDTDWDHITRQISEEIQQRIAEKVGNES